MKTYFVYVLQSLKDTKRYIGFTEDIERRLEEHKKGLVKSTKDRKPIKLVYTEEFNDKIEAMKRERFFKTGKGREFLSKVLK